MSTMPLIQSSIFLSQTVQFSSLEVWFGPLSPAIFTLHTHVAMCHIQVRKYSWNNYFNVLVYLFYPMWFFFWFLPWHWVVSACTCAKDLMETSADLLISYFVPLYSSSSLLSSIPPSVCWLPEPPQWKIYELYLYSLCFSAWKLALWRKQ